MQDFDKIMAEIELEAAEQTGTELGPIQEQRELTELTVKELTSMAESMGLQIGNGIKKAELLDMISKAQVAVPEPEPEQEPQADPEPHTQQVPELREDTASGRVLVTYAGLVNLRDESMQIIAQAIQGQVLRVVGKLTNSAGTWYRVAGQSGKKYLVSAEVVKYMV